MGKVIGSKDAPFDHHPALVLKTLRKSPVFELVGLNRPYNHVHNIA